MRQRDQFILLVTNSSVQLYLYHNGELSQHWMLETPHTHIESLTKYPKAPIHLLIDSSSFHKESTSLPRINPFDLLQWFQSKSRQWSESHSLAATQVQRHKGRWQLFKWGVGSEVAPWIQWLKNQTNPVGRIGLMACEFHALLQKLQNSSQWQMLLTLHEAGHMNLTLFNQGKLEHADQVAINLTSPPEELAQEILKGLETSLHNLCVQTPDLLEKVNVFAVIDEETQRYLKPPWLAPHQFHSLTPYQLATRIGLPGKVPFRLSDNLIIRHWVRRWKTECSLKSPLLPQRWSFFASPKLLGSSIAVLAVLGYVTLIQGSQSNGPIQETALTENLAHDNIAQKQPDIYLSSLIYIDDSHWTVWVNDEPLRATQGPHDLKIKSVKYNSLTFDHEGQTITLAPHQTYWPEENQIVTGDQRRNETPAD